GGLVPRDHHARRRVVGEDDEHVTIGLRQGVNGAGPLASRGHRGSLSSRPRSSTTAPEAMRDRTAAADSLSGASCDAATDGLWFAVKMVVFSFAHRCSRAP